MPKFNKLAGGIILNKKVLNIEKEHNNSKPSPIVKYSKLDSAYIYLTDGSYLATIGELKTL